MFYKHYAKITVRFISEKVVYYPAKFFLTRGQKEERKIVIFLLQRPQYLVKFTHLQEDRITVSPSLLVDNFRAQVRGITHEEIEPESKNYN